MKTLLVPLDFSPATSSVLEEASRLANALSAEVILMHSTQPPIVTSDYGLAVENVQEIVAVTEKHAGTQLSHALSTLEQQQIKTRVHHCHGSAITCIVEYAKEQDADYIIMGSHGHSAIYDLLIGSTTQGVLKAAPCPVIIVPAVKE
ncbi:MAG: universal stress protein [Opitutaceae bacterium]|nr:universal stress protein [Opitutaceae bacterium]